MADYDNTAPTANGLTFAWAPVRVVITANVDLQNLAAGATVDGVTIAEGDRLLVAAQTTAADNGVYLVVPAGVERASDADTAAEFVAGKFVRVTAGTVNAGTLWALTTTGAITLGSTALAFTRSTPSATAHNIAAGDNSAVALLISPTELAEAFTEDAPTATAHGIADFSNTAPGTTVVP